MNNRDIENDKKNRSTKLYDFQKRMVDDWFNVSEVGMVYRKKGII